MPKARIDAGAADRSEPGRSLHGFSENSGFVTVFVTNVTSFKQLIFTLVTAKTRVNIGL